MARKSTSSSARRIVSKSASKPASVEKPSVAPATVPRRRKKTVPVVVTDDEEMDSVEPSEVATLPPKGARPEIVIRLRRPTFSEALPWFVAVVMFFALVLPHLKKAGWLHFLPIPTPVSPVSSFSDVTTSVDSWLDDYAGDDLDSGKRKYIDALGVYLSQFDRYQTNVEAVEGFRNVMREQMGEVEFMNFGLFNVSLYELAKTARADGRLDSTAASHKPFFEALQKGLENAN